MLYDEQGRRVGMESSPIPTHFPQPGWVEQDPLEISAAQMTAARRVLEKTGVALSLIHI